MESAIAREKAIKKWNRAWKIRMVEEYNPTWDDLAKDLMQKFEGEDVDRLTLRILPKA